MTVMTEGPYRTDGGVSASGGLVLFALGLLAFAWALGVLRPGRAPKGGVTEPPWWHGYAYDLANLGAAATTSGGLALGGFAPPLALFGGFLVTLVVYLADQ